MEDIHQAQFENIIKQIEIITDELENLISLLFSLISSWKKSTTIKT